MQSFQRLCGHKIARIFKRTGLNLMAKTFNVLKLNCDLVSIKDLLPAGSSQEKGLHATG